MHCDWWYFLTGALPMATLSKGARFMTFKVLRGQTFVFPLLRSTIFRQLSSHLSS
jgi:hypothetical protein